MSSLAERCGWALFLFALAFSARVMFLENGWTVLLSLYPGVEYSYTDSEQLYTTILRWEEPKQNYNRSYGVIISTRCTYFHVWAMCFPFFLKRGWLLGVHIGGFVACIPALMKAFVFVSAINLVRFIILYSAVNADIPWWLAHDVPNVAFTTIALGLSVVYFLRKDWNVD